MKRLVSLLFLCFACSAGKEQPQLPPVCAQTDSVFPEVKIEAHTINVAPQVTTKTDAVSGAVVGGVLATGANIVTGGAATPLVALGGSAIGGLTGASNKTTISTEEIRTCSFRVTVDGNPMVYFGDSQDLTTLPQIAAFRKCTMLQVGDTVIPTLTCVERNSYYPNGYKTYMWVSGPTAGHLY